MQQPSPLSPNPSTLTIFCDGASRGNPGPAAAGFVAVDSKNQLLYQQGEYLGNTTNNVSEYQAVILALQWLVQNHQQFNNLTVKQFIVNLDSQLLHRQLLGQYKIKAPHLKPLHTEITQLLQQLQQQGLHITFQHQLRHHNKLADQLVNQILDEQH